MYTQMANTDIRLTIGFFENPKIRKLSRIAGYAAPLHLIKLWMYAASNRTSGILTGMQVEDIETVCDWDGEPGELCNAMVTCKLLDIEDGIYVIHNWAKRQPWAHGAEARSDKARMSRLAASNPQAYADLKSLGINGISVEDYDKLSVSRFPTNR